MKLHAQWHSFYELSPQQLYSLLRLRAKIFVVEQSCAYLDCDDRDQLALHRIVWLEDDKVYQPIACLRLLPPATDDGLPSLGRLATDPQFRGQKVATKLLQDGLEKAHALYPDKPVQISAQLYLQKYYEQLGFAATSELYSEDGILHITMIQSSAAR